MGIVDLLEQQFSGILNNVRNYSMVPTIPLISLTKHRQRSSLWTTRRLFCVVRLNGFTSCLKELDALAAQLASMGADAPPAAAASHAAADQSAGATAGATRGQPPLAESDSDSEDLLPTAPDGSLLVSEPPQPLWVLWYAFWRLYGWWYLCGWDVWPSWY